LFHDGDQKWPTKNFHSFGRGGHESIFVNPELTIFYVRLHPIAQRYYRAVVDHLCEQDNDPPTILSQDLVRALLHDYLYGFEQ
jgi:hypothetical protein